MSDVSIQRTGNRCTVSVPGPLTALHIPRLQQPLKAAIDDGVTEVEFDFGAVTLVDSSGIGLLIAAGNSLAGRGGSLRVVNVSDDIMRLFQAMRLVARLGVRARGKDGRDG